MTFIADLHPFALFTGHQQGAHAQASGGLGRAVRALTCWAPATAPTPSGGPNWRNSWAGPGKRPVPAAGRAQALEGACCRIWARGRGRFFSAQTEISSIYKRLGKVRKIHNLVFVPSLEDAERLPCGWRRSAIWPRTVGPFWGWIPATCWKSCWNARPTGS